MLGDARYPLAFGDEFVEHAKLGKRDTSLARLLHLASSALYRDDGAVVDLLGRAVAEELKDDKVVGAIADSDGVHLCRLDLHQAAIGHRPVADSGGSSER